MRGVFVTGTDTGVGKTLAACALIHALARAGARPVPMKPIAAGAVPNGGRLANDDTVALMRAARLQDAWSEVVTPVLLREPMAPHIAAMREVRVIGMAPIERALDRLSTAGDFLVVEGVGGFMVPLGPDLDTVALARRIGLPVVLVVGLRLGCLNHALLTAQAIERSGLPFAGWIANAIDPGMQAADENVQALGERLRAPLLARIPHAAAPDPRGLADRIDVHPLLAER